jgi:hypothetical protein
MGTRPSTVTVRAFSDSRVTGNPRLIQIAPNPRYVRPPTAGSSRSRAEQIGRSASEYQEILAQLTTPATGRDLGVIARTCRESGACQRADPAQQPRCPHGPARRHPPYTQAGPSRQRKDGKNAPAYAQAHLVNTMLGAGVACGDVQAATGFIGPLPMGNPRHCRDQGVDRRLAGRPGAVTWRWR